MTCCKSVLCCQVRRIRHTTFCDVLCKAQDIAFYRCMSAAAAQRSEMTYAAKVILLPLFCWHMRLASLVSILLLPQTASDMPGIVAVDRLQKVHVFSCHDSIVLKLVDLDNNCKFMYWRHDPTSDCSADFTNRFGHQALQINIMSPSKDWSNRRVEEFSPDKMTGLICCQC